MTRHLRLGTRRSALALAQASAVARAIESCSGHRVQLVHVVTDGDLSAAPLSRIGGTGVFVSALRVALARGEVDLAVHSLKDLPTAAEPGLVLAAVPRREDPRDALVSRHPGGLAGLPAGASVGTGSPRRAAQLRRARPDLAVVDLRGNVGTRLDRVGQGDLDAVVLAVAGLHRLGLADRLGEILPPATMLPAPGQGALAVECRAGDGMARAAVAVLDDAPTRAAVAAERSVLAALQAGCTAPLGALAVPGEADPVEAGTCAIGAGRPADPQLRLALSAVVVAPDGARACRSSRSGPSAQADVLGRTVADDLLRAGAAELVAEPS